MPPGYAAAAAGGARVVARAEALETVVEAVRAAGSLYAYAAAHPEAAALRGRGTAYRCPAPGGAWVVRHYRRGGAAAGLLGDRYLRAGTPRPIRELHASHAARRRGVPTPAVQAVVVQPAGLFYRADIATLAVPEARDLADATFGAAPLAADELCAAWRAAGSLLRHTFLAGLHHPDLNLMNVLVEGGRAAPRAWLIDLDRARVLEEALPQRQRERVVARFHRSRRKLAAAAGRAVPASARAAFEEALHA